MIKELEYDLNKEDYEKFVSIIYSNQKVTPKKINLLIKLLGLFVIFSFLGIFIVTNNFLFLLVCVIFVIFIFLPKNNFIKIFGKFENQKINLIVNSEEDTFSNKSDVSTTVVNWNKVLKIENTKDLMLVYTGQNQSIIIPKRIFETEQEMNETWELIQECYNKYKEVE